MRERESTAVAVSRVCLVIALFLVRKSYKRSLEVLCCLSPVVRFRDWTLGITSKSRSETEAHGRLARDRTSRKPLERTLPTIPTEEQYLREQWRERLDALRGRRQRVHGVDDTSVPDPRGMLFTLRARIYRPCYDGAAYCLKDLEREPRREPPWDALAVSHHNSCQMLRPRTCFSAFPFFHQWNSHFRRPRREYIGHTRLSRFRIKIDYITLIGTSHMLRTCMRACMRVRVRWLLCFYNLISKREIFRYPSDSV